MAEENSRSKKISTIPVKPALNGDIKPDDKAPALPLLVKKKNLEADTVFPTEPKSAYLSSYFRDSYDFPYNPDPLVSGNNYDTYDEMRHDDQIKAVLSFKKDQVICNGWQIVCESPEVVEFLENNLKERLEGSFEDSLRDILSSFDYGFSNTETIHRRTPEGLIEIKKFITRPPHTFEFHLDTKGDVTKVKQRTTEGDKDFKPDYFLHHAYQPEFGNPYGTSDLRAAFQNWTTKKFFLRFWAIYVERFASPTIIGEYPEDFDKAKASRLQTVLNTIQNSTVALVPMGTKIDFKMPNRDSSDIYEKGVTLLNTMIARAILMPDLMGMSGDQTKGGSYSLGQTQFELFMGMIRKEQENLARNLTIKVIRPIVQANFGDIPVQFQFKPYSKDDALETYKIWLDATKSHLWETSEEEVEHFLEGIKFPLPPGGIEIKDPMEAMIAGKTGIAPGQPGFGQPPKEKEDEEKEPKEKEEKPFSYTRIFRDFTPYERQIDFKQLQERLDKDQSKAERRLKNSARAIINDYIEQIRLRNLLGRFRPEAINELRINNQRDMNQEFRFFMKTSYTDAYNSAQKEFQPRASKKFAVTEEMLPEEFLTIIDAEAFKLVGDYSINITNKMRNTLVQGIKNGVNERELLSQLRELGENETDKWLKTVIRTKSTEMLNRGRKSYWDNDEFAKQIIEAYQFSAIMDDRTSDVCAYMDGKIFEKEEFLSNMTPPLHFNCRSILVPITKFEEYTAVEPPSLDTLKEKGGNLIV